MSRFSSRALDLLAAATALAAACLAFAPEAGATDNPNGIELSFGASYADNGDESDLDFSSYGARYHHDFSDRWGVELSYIRQDQDSLEADLVEASARFRIFANDRVSVFALGGAGTVSYDYLGAIITDGETTIFPPPDTSDDTTTWHLGIAAEIALSDRFYLRPDLRQRWAQDVSFVYDDAASEATFAAGFRF